MELDHVGWDQMGISQSEFRPIGNLQKKSYLKNLTMEIVLIYIPESKLKLLLIWGLN